MSELMQALVGIDIALGVIFVFKIIGVIADDYAWKEAHKRNEQFLRDHPPNTGTSGRPILSGKEDE